jgi:phage gpG-like protein
MIVGTVTGDAAVIARFEALPAKVRAALVDAMKREWFRIQAAVVTDKLSGDPLHRVTGVLASSVNVGGTDTATAFEETPAEIIGRIGTKVRYGVVHEKGGTFSIPAHERTISQVFGRPVTPHAVSVRAYTATFPQRSFLRSTLDEMAPAVRASIERAVAEALEP